VGVTLVCFASSYAVALGLEVLHLFQPRRVVRYLALSFGAAGLIAQTIYLAMQRPALIWQFGVMLFLAWILAVFYLFGSLHHRRIAWGVFVLPVILGLIGLAAAFGRPDKTEGRTDLLPLSDEHFWGQIHGGILLLAAVGVCVGFIAGVMYLIQAHRLRAKTLPGKGLRLLSLERLEQMNRRAVDLAFPLLTAGVVLGVVLLVEHPLSAWADLRVLSTSLLWLTFLVMLFLRYGWHLRGRGFAVLTIIAFPLLLCCLALAHPLSQGGAR
jgi:ABC-type transport system involved in cytochrome c biogenesis permease subunit